MNNKPLAWTEEELKRACRHAGLTEMMILKIKSYLPIYTHPVKELTDEEIIEVCKAEKFIRDLTPLIEFARAILRKAQEK